jgi:hypothetical protein
MAVFMAKQRVIAKWMIAVLLVLAVVWGCKKQEEPQASPEAVAAVPDDVGAGAGGALGILYVGHPGSAREKDFLPFLGKHFGTVKTADLAAFTESQCDGFDVTVLDYDGDGFEAPRPRISEGFARPIVTVGVAGALICGTSRLKTGYL